MNEILFGDCPPLFTTVSSDWVAPDLSTLPSWEGAKRVAIDCETRDPDLRKMIAEASK
jgi:hypothetical protein